MTLGRAEANAGTMSDEPDPIGQLSFEDALKRLEEIVRRLEGGDVPLDDAIGLYGEGEKLKQQCEARLAAAQERIDLIQLDRDGAPAGTTPFDA